MKFLLLPLLVVLVTLTSAAVPDSPSAKNGWEDDDDPMILDSSTPKGTDEATPNSETSTPPPPSALMMLLSLATGDDIKNETETSEFTKQNSAISQEENSSEIEFMPLAKQSGDKMAPSHQEDSSGEMSKTEESEMETKHTEDLVPIPLTYMVPPRPEEESVWSKYSTQEKQVEDDDEEKQDGTTKEQKLVIQRWARELRSYLDELANEVLEPHEEADTGTEMSPPKQTFPEMAAFEREPESYPIPAMQNSREYSPFDDNDMMMMTPPPPRTLMSPPPTPEEDPFYMEPEIGPSPYYPFGERYAANYLDSDYFYRSPPSPFYYNPNQYQIQPRQFSDNRVEGEYGRYNFPSDSLIGNNRNPYFNADQSFQSSYIFQRSSQNPETSYFVNPNSLSFNGLPGPVQWRSGNGYNNEVGMQIPRYNPESDWPMYAPSYPYPSTPRPQRQLPYRFNYY